MAVDPDELRHFYETATLRAPENSIGFVLWRVAHMYQRGAERVLVPLGLTHLQFTTLAMVGWLCRAGEPPTQAQLARDAEMHQMQISLMLKALEAKGLVERTPTQRDARVRCVAITPAGMAGLRAAMPRMIALQEQMFGRSGKPDGDLIRLLREAEERQGN